MRIVTAVIGLAFVSQGFAEVSLTASCCSCAECNGCPTPGRRLAWVIPASQKWAATDCCKICSRPSRAAPAAQPVPGSAARAALRIAPPTRGGAVSTVVTRALPESDVEEIPERNSDELRERNSDELRERTQTTLDVVLCRSERSRKLFRNMVSGFEMDANDRNKWGPNAFNVWRLFKSEMQLAGIERKATETSMSYMHSKLFDAPPSSSLDGTKFLPVLAMRGETACAAATFSDAHHNDHNSYELLQIISNAGPGCKGGGAALLCYLIRNSKDKNMDFSPLRVEPVPNDPLSKRWFESFGCQEPHGLLRFLDDVTGYMPLTSGPAVCSDPSPKRCDQYNDIAVDADGYFGQMRTGYDKSWKLSALTPTEVSSIPVCALLGLLVGSGVALALLFTRSRVPAESEETLLAA